MATDVGGNRELIKNNKTGFLLSFNSDSFMEKIDYIFNHKSEVKKIIDNAYIFSLQYDWSVIGKKYLDLYKKFLD